MLDGWLFFLSTKLVTFLPLCHPNGFQKCWSSIASVWFTDYQKPWLWFITVVLEIGMEFFNNPYRMHRKKLKVEFCKNSIYTVLFHQCTGMLQGQFWKQSDCLKFANFGNFLQRDVSTLSNFWKQLQSY